MGKDLKRSIRWLEGIPAVTKVILGFSEACRHKYAPGTIRFKMNAEGGIKINGYSGTGVTDIFVKIDPISERDNVKLAIAKKFSVIPANAGIHRLKKDSRVRGNDKG